MFTGIIETTGKIVAVEQQGTNKRFVVASPISNELKVDQSVSHDGHVVQGHVDATAVCTVRREMNGSWQYSFEFPPKFAPYIIEKGSISLNGISLTIFNVTRNGFDVAIIPYTFGHTNIQFVHPGSTVNLEFDVIGKYVQRYLSLQRP